MTSFNDWWKTVPADFQQKSFNGDEQNKPLLNQINYAFLHLHLAKSMMLSQVMKSLKDWLHSGQINGTKDE